MYEFRDINSTVSEGNILPSEALMINGEYIENLIPGYRTLTVSGREALSPEIETYETGIRDGSTLQNKRYPARIITVTYQLIAENNEAFREAYNQLGGVLNVEEAELIFNDEPDKFFTGTPSAIGAVPPGRNAVTGEFELFCADPFKYSVVEYEAEPTLADGTILIDYNGTYKSYPTLEAAFYEEDDNTGDMPAFGDCGYVAFFNEEEKIIQLGDPDETDAETAPSSQTLVNQKFNTDFSWEGSIAEQNWKTKSGKLNSTDVFQDGSMKIAVASYEKAPSSPTSGTLLTKTSKAAKPYIDYKVTAETSGRTASSVTVEVTVAASLKAQSSSGTVSLTAGAAITLNDTNYYVSSTATSKTGTKTGTFYLWDNKPTNNRIRFTNSISNVGKSDKVTGWVNVSDIGVSSTTAVLGKGYGLKAGIKFGTGSWNEAVLKSESVAWEGNKSYTVKLKATVNNLSSDTTLLDEIQFRVTRTDGKSGSEGELEDSYCKNLEISSYVAPVANSWYLMPKTYGSGSAWHGASITRTIPADQLGEVGAKSFTLTYKQKMSIGSGSSSTKEHGMFQALLVSGSGTSRKIVAGVNIIKSSAGKTGKIRFYVNGKNVLTTDIDLSYNNKYFGNNSSAKGITTVKTSTIKKSGSKVEFNIGGMKKTFSDKAIKDTLVKEITFFMGQYGNDPNNKPILSYNGLYWAKFVKNNSETWEDIPNKFSSNDVVTADCKNGEVYLNDILTPSLGALGNDWENFYLTPGLNQIGYSYSDWVTDKFAPNFRVRYREVFL